jgi:hypothetical protein
MGAAVELGSLGADARAVARAGAGAVLVLVLQWRENGEKRTVAIITMLPERRARKPEHRLHSNARVTELSK